MKLTKKDKTLIDKIVARAKAESQIPGENLSTIASDIAACHLNGTPIRLEKLLKADNFVFWHDIRGIRRYIDRDTGKFKLNFAPRTAAFRP